MHACSSYWGSDVLGSCRLPLESQSSAGIGRQPYPRALDLVWPGHLHGTGCLMPGLWTLGFHTVVWRLCWGLGFAVTPPILAGVLGQCAWVLVLVSSPLSWLGFGVCEVGPGCWPASRHFWLGFSGVRGCVRAPPAARRYRLSPAVWVCVLGLGFRLCPTTPCLGVVVCVCVFVCALRWYPANPGWGVRCGCVCLNSGCSCALPLLAAVFGGCVCVCVRAPPVRCGCVFLGSGFGCFPPLLAGVLGCVCVWVRAPLLPRQSWLRCAV